MRSRCGGLFIVSTPSPTQRTGRGITIKTACPLHLNLTSALLDTLDDYVRIFSSITGAKSHPKTATATAGGNAATSSDAGLGRGASTASGAASANNLDSGRAAAAGPAEAKRAGSSVSNCSSGQTPASDGVRHEGENSWQGRLAGAGTNGQEIDLQARRGVLHKFSHAQRSKAGDGGTTAAEAAFTLCNLTGGEMRYHQPHQTPSKHRTDESVAAAALHWIDATIRSPTSAGRRRPTPASQRSGQGEQRELGKSAAAAAAAREWNVLQYLSHNGRHPLFFAATKTIHSNNGVWEVPFDIQAEVNAPDETVLYAKAVPRRVTGSAGVGSGGGGGGGGAGGGEGEGGKELTAGVKSSHSVLVQMPGHEWVYGVSADQLGIRSFDLQPSSRTDEAGMSATRPREAPDADTEGSPGAVAGHRKLPSRWEAFSKTKVGG